MENNKFTPTMGQVTLPIGEYNKIIRRLDAIENCLIVKKNSWDGRPSIVVKLDAFKDAIDEKFAALGCEEYAPLNWKLDRDFVASADYLFDQIPQEGE